MGRVQNRFEVFPAMSRVQNRIELCKPSYSSSLKRTVKRFILEEVWKAGWCSGMRWQCVFKGYCYKDMVRV